MAFVPRCSFRPAASAVTGSRSGRGHSALRKASTVSLLGADASYFVAMPPGIKRHSAIFTGARKDYRVRIRILCNGQRIVVYKGDTCTYVQSFFVKTSASSHMFFTETREKEGEGEGEGKGGREGEGEGEDTEGVDENHLQLGCHHQQTPNCHNQGIGHVDHHHRKAHNHTFSQPPTFTKRSFNHQLSTHVLSTSNFQTRTMAWLWSGKLIKAAAL